MLNSLPTFSQIENLKSDSTKVGGVYKINNQIVYCIGVDEMRQQARDYVRLEQCLQDSIYYAQLELNCYESATEQDSIINAQRSIIGDFKVSFIAKDEKQKLSENQFSNCEADRKKFKRKLIITNVSIGTALVVVGGFLIKSRIP